MQILNQLDGLVCSISLILSKFPNTHLLNSKGFDGIRDWIENFPKIWLNKRRDIALEQTREQILTRIKTPIKKEKVEVGILEGDQSGSPNPVFVTERQDWDAAWDFEEDNPTQKSEVMDHDIECKTKSDSISDV